MSRVLGVVLAGGQSRRFGSDKALARIDGATLLDRAVAALGRHCDAVVVAGRFDAPAPVIGDAPRAGLGPLGGLCAAMNHAAAHGFDEVLSIPVDGADLPDTILDELHLAPAHSAAAPVIGLWPVTSAPTLAAMLEPCGERGPSVRAFAAAIGARPVALSRNPFNINTPADLAAAQECHHGL